MHNRSSGFSEIRSASGAASRDSLRDAEGVPDCPLPEGARDARREGGANGAGGADLRALSLWGREWRMGSVNPDWRRELAALSSEPEQEKLEALGKRGIWLHPAELPPPAAFVCCGLGSVYPGMGRELYDAFPPAREAMDRVAAAADWDVLALMDEKDEERIVLTRWQQPYLFLLEYAQACCLQSLGLRPAVIAGHSLGELIALCLAGAYTPEGAWHILDRRALLVSEWENDARHDTGMMSVHADGEAVERCLEEFPGLLVSNYNTPTQFVLSGPRDVLRAASRALRKRRIPAMQLKVGLAFHHPGMRALREFSLQGLRAVSVRETRVPMLSCVTADLYPDDAEGIRGYMVNLDENPVRWVECVDGMWQRHKVRHFVELGPGDTLCGLVSDIRPQAVCIPAGRKGKEAAGLRAAAARLHALGHLPAGPAGVFVPSSPPGPEERSAARESPPASGTGAPAGIEDIMPMLAAITGFSRNELAPDMDLRHDLLLRSSRFPLLMHEVEKRFALSLRFEDLAGVESVRELAERIHSLRARAGRTAGAEPNGVAPASSRNASPLLRYGLRLAPFTPPRAPSCIDGNETPGILVAGRGPAAEAARAFLLSRCGGTAATFFPTPREALESARERAFRALLLFPDPVSGGQEGHDSVPALSECFSLMQAFLRRKEARVCLAAGIHRDGAPPDPVLRGCIGIMSAAASEYPDTLFRALCLADDALSDAADWLLPASASGGDAARAPLQWILRDKVWLSPRIVPRPLDPGPGTRERALLRPGDVVVVSGGGRGPLPSALRECAALGCRLVFLEDGGGRGVRAAELEELAALGAEVECREGGGGGFEAAGRVLGGVRAAHGRLDGLICAGGTEGGARMDALTPAIFEQNLRSGCGGAPHLARAALPLGLRWAAAFLSAGSLWGEAGQTCRCAADRHTGALLRGLCRGCAHLRLFWLPSPGSADAVGEVPEHGAARLSEEGGGNFCGAGELSHILARELACSREEDILPARSLPGAPALLPPPAAETRAEKTGSAPRPEDFPLLAPRRHTAGEEAEFEADCRFSSFRDRRLAEASFRPGVAPRVSSPVMLACLMEGALQNLPWLVPTGAAELEFSPAACPDGVTREGVTLCRALPAERGRRLCGCELRLRELTANGRAGSGFSSCCSGRVELAPAPPSVLSSLWPDAASPERFAPRVEREALARRFGEYSGAAVSRFLPDPVHELDGQRILAGMRVPAASDIVGLENPRYVYPLHILEALGQAAFLLALERISGQSTRVGSDISHIAALRFSRCCAPGEAIRLEARPVAGDMPGVSGARRLAFDAEARDGEGRLVMCAHALCFSVETR
jgi:malonyl CoA-acyl carrier protein transacylase